MPLNAVENWLRERRQVIQMNFSEPVATADRYMHGPGNFQGDGYPFPRSGKVISLDVYDGTSVRSSDIASPFDEGDRISVVATYDQPWFQVTVMKNGVATGTYANQCLSNTTLIATVHIRYNTS